MGALRRSGRRRGRPAPSRRDSFWRWAFAAFADTGRRHLPRSNADCLVSAGRPASAFAPGRWTDPCDHRRAFWPRHEKCRRSSRLLRCLERPDGHSASPQSDRIWSEWYQMIDVVHRLLGEEPRWFTFDANELMRPKMSRSAQSPSKERMVLKNNLEVLSLDNSRGLIGVTRRANCSKFAIHESHAA
jgi:hypothetical protein